MVVLICHNYGIFYGSPDLESKSNNLATDVTTPVLYCYRYRKSFVREKLALFFRLSENRTLQI
jgi:hypothetical protein